MLSTSLPNARYLLGDKAYDADHWRGFDKLTGLNEPADAGGV